MSQLHEIIFITALIFAIFFSRRTLAKIFFVITKQFLPIHVLDKIKFYDVELQKLLSTVVSFAAIVIALASVNFLFDVKYNFTLCLRLLFLIFLTVVALEISNICFKFLIPQKYIGNKAMDGLLRFAKRLINSALIVVFLVAFIGTCGVSVSGLLTTLGLGGAALALASKDSLANLFGSISLISDRVFQVGDVVKINNVVEGTVEDIGLRSTKIRTSMHSLVTIPNSMLSNIAVDNLSQMHGKFIVQSLFVSEGNDVQKIDAFVTTLSEQLKQSSEIQLPIVSFYDFTQNGIQISISYLIPNDKCHKYYNIRNEINQLILKILHSIGLKLMFIIS